MARKPLLIPLAACLWLGVSVPSQEAGKGREKFTLPELEGVLLGEKEVPGFRLDRQNRFRWWKGETPEGEGLSRPGVIQEFRDQHDRLLLVSYACFPDSAQARQAAGYYSVSMASVFREGLWKGWRETTIGDARWVSLRSTGAGLLVHKGTLCLLIGCHIQDPQEAQRLAFFVAQRILAKEACREKQQKAAKGEKAVDSP